MLLHASCVAVEGKAVLLSGPSGIGKSDLALRLIDTGARLVADDQTLLHRENGVLCASPPPAIAGLIEIRPLGLMKMPFVAAIPVALFIDLMPSDAVLPRMAEPTRVFLLDQPVQRLNLHAFSPSTAAKIRAALIYERTHD